MIVQYENGKEPKPGKKGSEVRRVISGRQVITPVITPLYRNRTVQQNVRGAHNTLLAQWETLTPEEKQTWRDTINRPGYPPPLANLFPGTPNNLYYQINKYRQAMGLGFVRVNPGSWWINERSYMYWQTNLLPERVVVKVEASDGAIADYMQIWIGPSDIFKHKKEIKDLRHAGFYKFKGLTTIDLTDVWLYYFGKFDYSFNYLYAVAVCWDSVTMSRGAEYTHFEVLKKQ